MTEVYISIFIKKLRQPKLTEPLTNSPSLFLRTFPLYSFIHCVKDFLKVICPAVCLPAAEVDYVSFVSVQSGKVNTFNLAGFVHA